MPATSAIGAAYHSGGSRRPTGVHVPPRAHLGKERARMVAPLLERRCRESEPFPERAVAVHRRHIIAGASRANSR